MKRYISVFLAFTVVISLWACTSNQSPPADTVTFYYVRREITYGGSDGVIAGETREAQGYTDNLTYLLLLYLSGGPASADLRSPFPAGLKLVRAEQIGETINIILSASFENLDSMEKMLACACLTLTCLKLTDASIVCISTEDGLEAGEKPIIMDSDCLLLLDDGAFATSPTDAANP